MGKKEAKPKHLITGMCTDCGKKGGREIFGVFTQCPICGSMNIDFNNKEIISSKK